MSSPKARVEELLGGLPTSIENVDDETLTELLSAGTAIQSAYVQTEQFMRSIKREFGLYWLNDPPPGAIAIARGGRPAYPGFQFMDGRLKPVITQLTTIAAKFDLNQQDIFYWLCAPTTYIRGGARPVDLLDSDPAGVLRIASDAWGVVW